MSYPGLFVTSPYNITGSDNVGRNRDLYTQIVKTFISASGWEQIAKKDGTNANVEPQASTEPAWTVFRSTSGSVTFDVGIAWTYNNFWPEGSWEVGSSNWGVGIAVAYHSSSQAWNGTVNNDGTDSFPSNQPWKSGSIIFPRQNSFGGVHGTEGARDYMHPVFVTATTGSVLTAIAHEHIFIAMNYNQNQPARSVFQNLVYFGKYIPLSGAGVDFPYIFHGFNDVSSNKSDLIVTDKTYGSIIENNNNSAGVAISTSSNPTVCLAQYNYDPSYQNSSSSLPTQSGSIFNEYPYFIIPLVTDTTRSLEGPVGYIDFFKTQIW